MKALLLVAHGNRLIESNQSVALLSEKLQLLDHGKYDYIRYAFLEFAKPTISDSINELIQMNIEDITVFPYFLSPGIHVKNDIPALISSFLQKNPGIKITLLPHFGSLSMLPEFIAGVLFK